MFLSAGIIPWGPQVQEILDLGKRAVQQTVDSMGTLVSVLLRGTEKASECFAALTVLATCSYKTKMYVSIQVTLVVARLPWLHT